MKRLISAALVGSLVGCATPHTQRLRSITITQRGVYAICAGYCPNIDITVREDGQVTLSKPRSEEPDEITHLQVTSGQAARFFVS